jgi:hypothetical protein
MEGRYKSCFILFKRCYLWFIMFSFILYVIYNMSFIRKFNGETLDTFNIRNYTHL